MMHCVVCVNVCFPKHGNFIQYFKKYIECITLIGKAVSNMFEPEIQFLKRSEY